MDHGNETLAEIREERTIRTFFLGSVLIKGIISFAEIVAGILIYFVPPTLILGLVIRIASIWLLSHPDDLLATHIVSYASGIVLPSQLFLGTYLLLRGLIKFVLIIGMLRDILWTYPSSLAVIGGLVCYQIYQYTYTHSSFLIALTIFDLFVMYFIYREYQILKAHSLLRKN